MTVIKENIFISKHRHMMIMSRGLYATYHWNNTITSLFTWNFPSYFVIKWVYGYKGMALEGQLSQSWHGHRANVIIKTQGWLCSHATQ